MVREGLGVVGAGVAVVSYLPYVRHIVLKKTRPHVFSWLIWGSLAGVGFMAQIKNGAGTGALVTGVTAAAGIGIFIASFFVGDRSTSKLDRLSLAGAALAALAWPLTDSPLSSVAIVTLIDALGYVPTFRKCYFAPRSETLSTYVLSAVKFVFSAVALAHFTLVTALFPVVMIIVDIAFIVMVVARRRTVSTLMNQTRTEGLNSVAPP